MPTDAADTPVLVDRDRGGAVVRLTLNRPAKRNALSKGLLDALEAQLAAVAADPAVRAVVVAANGPVFSAGHDLAEMATLDEPGLRDLFGLCSRVMLGLRRLPVPVVARVHGLATAAGCQLVAACDLAVASEAASFATPGVKIGLFCTTPMIPLVRAVPAKPALEMLMTGAPISAARALELGLVNRVAPADGLDAAVDALLDALLASSPLVLAIGKRAFYDLAPLTEEEAYARALGVMTDNALRHDGREGVAAFLGKRPPVWRGE